MASRKRYVFSHASWLFSSYLQVVGWYVGVAVDEGCKNRLEGQVRRLRNLSQDSIDPIAKEPSLINEVFSARNAETKGQRITRVLRNAYDEVVKAHDEMRELHTRSHAEDVAESEELFGPSYILT
jgi:uncharacterized protein (DUF2342 family)